MNKMSKPNRLGNSGGIKKTNNMKKLLERLYDKISNFLFGGKIMCRR